MVLYKDIKVLDCRIEKEDLGKTDNIRCSFKKINNVVNYVKEVLYDVIINAEVHDLHFKGWFNKPNVAIRFNVPVTCEVVGEVFRHDNKEHFTLECDQQWSLHPSSDD